MGETQVIDISSYPEFASSLIPSLESPEEQNLASAWLNRLVEDMTASEELKTKYFKLFTDFLKMQKLDGPFKNDPSQVETLTEIQEAENISGSSSTKKRRRFAPELFGKIKAKSTTLKAARAQKEAEAVVKKGKTLDKNAKLSDEKVKADSRLKEFFSRAQQRIRQSFKWVTFRSDTPPEL